MLTGKHDRFRSQGDDMEGGEGDNEYEFCQGRIQEIAVGPGVVESDCHVEGVGPS